VSGFFDLPLAKREEVARFAKMGERHPDPEVAATASVWAHEEMARETSRWVTVAVDLGLGIFLGSGGGISGLEISRRRLAKRLVALDPL
jgi:hypothetical protein